MRDWVNLIAVSALEVDLASTCANHPNRPAHALCMSCGKAVCQECATTREGIYYCATCLARPSHAARAGVPWLAWIATLAAAAGLFWALTRLMVWAGVLATEIL
jgi:hypothetical protein